MIDIKTLRIGCHVLYKDERWRVAHLDSRCVGFDDSVKFTFVEPKDIQPIPITEELLKELGFEIRPFKYRLRAEKYLSEYDEFVMLERLKGEDKFDVYLYITREETHKTHLKYLHEIQNFVFMATKKELL